MRNLSDPQVIAVLAAIIVMMFGYAFLIPRNEKKFEPEDVDKRGIRLLNRFSKEVYSSLPEGTTFKSRSNAKIDTLMIHSGNPWKLTTQEFIFIKYVTAFVGFLAGFLVWFLIKEVVGIPLIAVLALTTILGYFTPTIKYKDEAKNRDLEFKRQLPEALDLIIFPLRGGLTFPQALRESIPNMRDGILKEEFKEVIKQIDTGRSVTEALNFFANRAPNEGVQIFVQAVSEANDLNVPIAEVMQSRAQASREEFHSLIQIKTATLDSKIMMVLAPTLLPALLIILLGPTLYFFTSQF